MTRRTNVILALTVIGIICIFVYAIYQPSEYVPSERQIRSHGIVQPFIIDAKEISGIYANTDIDSIVFRYTTNVNEESFWNRVDRQVQGTQWVPLPSDGNIRRFQKILPPQDQQRSWWIDEIRIRYTSNSQEAIVGWVQADPPHAVTDLSQCKEALFAERTIWPILRR